MQRGTKQRGYLGSVVSVPCLGSGSDSRLDGVSFCLSLSSESQRCYTDLGDLGGDSITRGEEMLIYPAFLGQLMVCSMEVCR